MLNSVKTNPFLVILVLLCALRLDAKKDTPGYIDQYKTIVVNEMDRTGIPASIKMAQAIIESGSGQSTLARQSNNHFGIKCGKDWTGRTFYREDDDYKNGLLIKSCFRAYDDPADSFIAHSDFLRDNRRYAFLFEMDPYDYRGWAHGLKQAGYATDPAYPSKLIDVIERYQLYHLDRAAPIIVSHDEILVQADDTKMETSHPSLSKEYHEPKSAIIISAKPTSSDRDRYPLTEGYYTFQSGDDLASVAQHFKVPLKDLYFRNRLPYGSEPVEGSHISIHKYIHLKKTPDLKTSQESVSQDFLWEETIVVSSL